MRQIKRLAIAILSVTLAIFPVPLSVAYTSALPRHSVILPQIDITDVSNHVARVGGVPAVLFVVEKLFDDIDYVMDPANNRVIFKPEKPISLCTVRHLDWTWLGDSDYVANQYCVAIRNPPNGHIFGDWEQYADYKRARATCNDGDGGSAFVDCGNPTDEIFIGYDYIAQEILNNALQGHEDSISFIQEAAKASVEEQGNATEPTNPSTAAPPLQPMTTPP